MCDHRRVWVWVRRDVSAVAEQLRTVYTSGHNPAVAEVTGVETPLVPHRCVQFVSHAKRTASQQRLPLAVTCFSH